MVNALAVMATGEFETYISRMLGGKVGWCFRRCGRRSIVRFA